MSEQTSTTVSPFRAGITCRCPGCGKGKLFSGLLEVVSQCEVCDLDLAAEDAGDGPAVFVILILGFVIVGLALWVEFTFSPPLWVHPVLWFPLIIGGSVGLLRVFKATLIALQFHHKSGTGVKAEPSLSSEKDPSEK
jgi:uncharacterized protein (DUF983 family)